MRLGVAHEAGFAVAMTSSIAIVLFGGELPGFAWLVCLAPLVSLLLATRDIRPPALSATLVGVASIALGIVTVARGGIESSVLAGGELLMGLLTARLLVRRTQAHDMQALSLSLLLVLTGSVLNVKITYLPVFVVYAVTAVWALSTRQLLAGAAAVVGDERDRAVVRARKDVVTPAFFGATGLISLAVLASAAAVFALFPRVGFGDIGAFLHKDSTLPGSVGLRGDPRLSGGSAVVARLRDVPRDAFLRGLYLRGAVYDVINLDGFSQTARLDEERAGGKIELVEPPLRTRYEVTVMPVVGDTLLSLGDITALRVVGGGNANPNVPMSYNGRSVLDESKAVAPLRSAMRYIVVGGVAAPGLVPRGAKRPVHGLSAAARARYLKLPDGFDDKLRDLVQTALGDAAASGAAVDKAARLRAFFLDNFRYSQEPPRFATSPLRTFLFDERQGHCEFFASAYAMMLRGAGVPARVVGGFQGGAWDDGVVVFAERNAHAWVEWWDDDAGWVVDDATPLATAPREELSGLSTALERVRRFWDDTILDYSLQDQVDGISQAKSALSGLKRTARVLVALMALLLIVPGVVAALLLRRRRRRARGAEAVHPLARAIVDAVARATRAPVPAEQTVREAVEGARVDAALAAALRAALSLYEAERFGGAHPPAVVVKRAAKALRTAARNR